MPATFPPSRSLAATLLMALVLPATAAAPRISGGNEALHPFDYHGVRLTDSHWQRQQRDVLEYYLAVPNDDYLVGFRKRAGKPAPGKELGGWYSDDRFNTFGQILSGLARFHAATGDPRAKAKVDDLVAGFVDCIESDGYHFYSRKTNAPHYEFDKFLGGLIDAHLYCGNAQAKDAIGRITDWAIKHLDPNPSYPQKPGTPNVEGYTLTENLYRAHLLTGEQKYRDFGKHWEYWAWWDKFTDNAPEDLYTQPSGRKVPHYHAYSHVNALNGLATGYMVTKDDRYLAPLRNAYDFLRRDQAYATGGYGPMERITHRDFLASSLDWSHSHFETQCGSWAVFKVSKYLASLTGDARYADWAEQMVYNGVGGTRQMDDHGHVQYFSNYSSRGATKINVHPWSCCTGTRPQAVADYTDLIYLHDDAGVYVNLFLPSELTWDRDGGRVRLALATRFPAEDTVTLTVGDAPSAPFTIHVRKPTWLAGDAELRVNGQPVKAQAGDKNWLAVSRTWKAGDVLTARLPMKLKWQPFNPDKPFPGAVTYGPVTLAWQSEQPNPAAGRTPDQLLSSLERQPGDHLLWKASSDPSLTLGPWYQVAPDEKYFVYLDPAAGQYVQLGTGWRTNERHMICELPNSEATFQFTGTGVRVLYSLFDDAGLARVTIDGKDAGTIDQYGPKRNVDASKDFSGLAPGKHTLKIVCTGERNPASRARVINIRRFEPLDPAK